MIDGLSYAILGANLENYDVNCKNYKINQRILAHAESESVLQIELIAAIKELAQTNVEILEIIKKQKENDNA